MSATLAPETSVSGRRAAAVAVTRLAGSEFPVPCADGLARPYVDLDHAASTPPLPAVWSAVAEFMPWYSSVHRGSGAKSRVSTAAFEGVRDVVAAFVGAQAREEVVFVRSTTEAINLLAATLPAGSRVISTPVEHHANLLPWARHDLRLLPFPASADALCDDLDAALAAAPADLVAVTGASNVTGEVWPLARLAEIAHAHGARLFVDAAQLAPHRAIDMAATGIDLLAFSGHKLYAPFGAGALVGPLGDAAPLLHGGGAVKLVTADVVVLADAPERFEAGSPNTVGVVALGAALEALMRLGMDAVAAHEQALAERLRAGLDGLPGVELLELWPGADVDRVALATFTVAGLDHHRVADRLADEHGIGVRHGCFCAHPLITRLLGVAPEEVGRLLVALRAGAAPPLPGAVRASLGLGTTPADVDRLLDALAAF